MFFSSITSVSVGEARKAAKEPNTDFIDVRTRAEFKSGHAAGARNVPLDTFDDIDLDELKRADAVYVICQSGGRSSAAVRELKQAGVKAINVSGGTLAWHAAGLPMK